MKDPDSVRFPDDLVFEAVFPDPDGEAGRVLDSLSVLLEDYAPLIAKYPSAVEVLVRAERELREIIGPEVALFAEGEAVE
jgi:hypothetical protein